MCTGLTEKEYATDRGKMSGWNLKLIFISILLQTSLAEVADGDDDDDGEAFFFGLPVPPKTHEGNSASPLQTLLESTFHASDAKEAEDTNVPIQIETEEKMVAKPNNTATAPTLVVSLATKLDEPEAIEFPKEDPGSFLLQNTLQTEETSSKSQRQPLNAVTLAALIRSAIAFARPLTGESPLNLQNLFPKSNRDPLRDILFLAEGVITRMGNTITKQNPIDFLNLVDNMQNAIDRMGGEGGCTPFIELMDQTTITLKELIETLHAVQKLGEMWSSANISALKKCIGKTGGLSPEGTQTSSKAGNADKN